MIFWIFLASAFAWLIVMLTERRTVLSGFLLLLTGFLLGSFIISEAVRRPEWFSEHLLFHILLDIELIFLSVLLIAYPLVLIPVFLIGGLVIMKKEGVRFRNGLSIGLAALLILFETIYPMVFDVTAPGLPMWIYWYMTIISMYFVIQLASFWLSDVLNLIHIKKNKGIRYVVVLGAGLSGEKPTPLLRSRIDRGIEVYRNNPGAKLVMSGGQGKDELLPESYAMADYAVSVGVPDEDIIREAGSKNTDENIRFSYEMIKEDSGDEPAGKRVSDIAVVTSSYHVMRALLIARRQHVKCIGYGARTKLYFSLNAMLREYAGYFRDTRITRIVHILIVTILYVMFIISRT